MKRRYENRIELLQGTLENNQRVKTYQLTAAGRKHLAAERSN